MSVEELFNRLPEANDNVILTGIYLIIALILIILCIPLAIINLLPE
jgi:hypothetical protein